MLCEKFEDLLRKISAVKLNSEPVLFSRETFSEPGEFSEFGGFKTASRQRFTANGLIDNLIVETDKKTARLFGIWLLAAVFQRKYPIYCIKLVSGGSVKEIRLVLKNPPKIIVELVSFEWQPCKIEKFVTEADNYLGDIPCVYLTNETGKWIGREEFQARDVVEIVSSVGGAIFLAEFFLNIGIDEANVNYEYLKYQYGSSVLSSDSCEMRVEVFHEIAGEKNIIPASVN